VQLQLSELVNLTVGLVVLPLLVVMVRRVLLITVRVEWLVAYLAVLASYTFTVIEGVGGVPGEWFNVLEHLSLLVAGAAFLVAVVRLRALIRSEYR
jgi:hypothetical protein